MKFVVITSIFEPTEAVQAFAELDNCRVLVVGDRKTPENWSCEDVDYLSVHRQLDSCFRLAALLPYNHYCRKMLGYLHAIGSGAKMIVDTDDDNIPKQGWGFPAFEGSFDRIFPDKGFVNIYQLYTDQKIWPRGLPLNLINTSFDLHNFLEKKHCSVGIWQGLADEDPDVDAIYRLTDNSPCYFRERPPIVLGTGTMSPFNSQNTLIREKLFPLLYLPSTVTFRYTDILRSWVAQPIMWLYNYTLGFTGASVVQKRNPHNYMKDFISEIPMYEQGERVVEYVTAAITSSASLEDNLFKAYQALSEKSIVSAGELITLEAWLNDLSRIKQKYHQCTSKID